MKNQRKLRNYLIKRKMQLRVTMKFILLSIFFTLIGELLMYAVLWPTFKSLIPSDMFPTVKINLIFIFFWYNLTLLVMLVLFGIVITHRFAGPVYIIEREIDHLIQGEDVKPIYLRRGDELQELANKINVLLQKTKETKDV